jgi:tetratricopeptide (TPR) repeat protein
LTFHLQIESKHRLTSASSSLLRELAGCQFLRFLQRIGSLHRDIWFYARAFPVGFGNGIDCSRKWHSDHEVVFQHAVQLDPTFATAYERIGSSYSALGEPGRATQYLTEAFHLREHASERKKLYITVAYYSAVTGEVDKAVETLQEEIQTYPREYRAHVRLGNAYVSLGQWEKARDAYSYTIGLAPDGHGVYDNLTNSLLALQRLEEARQTAQQARNGGEDFVLHNALYALAFIRADSQAMAQQQHWFAGKPEENSGLSLASDTEAYGGHLHKARELTNTIF